MTCRRPLLHILGALACTAFWPHAAQAQEAIARVVDVGPGLCVVISMPGQYDILYDGGHWQGSTCRAAVEEMVQDERIEFVVLSHSDGDHLGELPEILAEKSAGVILMTGFRRDTNTFEQAIDVVGQSVAKGTTVLNLETWPLAPGTEFSVGPARLTFLAGWHKWDESLSDHSLDQSELRNVVSIVMRFDYEGRSILLAGDTVGRAIGAPADTCQDAERFMVERDAEALRSDVLIAGHHGADNASATCFIEAVDPQFVVFSAGHSHEHPRQATAERFLAAGIPSSRMLRTDRSDDEGGEEWNFGREENCTDGRSDDDIEIRLPADPEAEISVAYREESPGC